MPGNDTFDLSGPHLTELQYDYYMYWEGDMEVPADSFNFWRMHVEDLYDRGARVPEDKEPTKHR
eukprot:1822916-Amphidinium_carterae.1